MGAIINLENIKSIYCNGVEISTVYLNNDTLYQNSIIIDPEYNYFTFDTSLSNSYYVKLANYRAGDTTEWNGYTNWGDGTIDKELSHWYSGEGIYTVKTKWMLSYPSGDSYSIHGETSRKLVACDNININISDMTNIFRDCQYLKSVDLSRFNTMYKRDMNHMFYNCYSLEVANMEGWDTSNVTSMKNMFYKCKVLTPQVSHFNTSSVTDMSGMFAECGAIDGSQFSNWDVSSVMFMSNMFYYATVINNLDLAGWDVSNVSFFPNMFYYCKVNGHIDISDWDIKSNSSVFDMFTGASCGSTCSNIEHHVIHDGVPSDDWNRMKK